MYRLCYNTTGQHFTLEKSEKNKIEDFEIWRRMERIRYLDGVNNEEVLRK